MRLLICPDSFKESLTALEAAQAMATGWCRVFPAAQCELVPMADGGEGTVAALVAARAGQIRTQQVCGPLQKPVQASWGWLPARSGLAVQAVLEMSAASGLHWVPLAQRDPRLTTSWGTGELIRAALDAGARHLILGLGGSATNDGGAGLLQALGAQLLDARKQPIGPGAQGLAQLHSIDLSRLDKRLEECQIKVACDVTNPLVGPQGASAVFGPQKGADAAMVEQLDQWLAHYGALLEQATGKILITRSGAGAAGGMGAALAALGAELTSGINLVMAAADLASKMVGADLVITGEGRLDGQTLQGKTPWGVAQLAGQHAIPVIGIGGSLGEGAEALYDHGFAGIIAAVQAPVDLTEALSYASVWVERATEQAARLWQLGAQSRIE